MIVRSSVGLNISWALFVFCPLCMYELSLLHEESVRCWWPHVWWPFSLWASSLWLHCDRDKNKAQTYTTFYHNWQSSNYSTYLWGTMQTSNRYSTVLYSQYCNAICWGFVEEKAVLCWESQHLDVSVPSVSELMMMYTSSRQILACDVAACRYAFGCLQSSLCGSGTSGALCFMSLLLHIIISPGQTLQSALAALLSLSPSLSSLSLFMNVCVFSSEISSPTFRSVWVTTALECILCVFCVCSCPSRFLSV